jgi:hypothetical protein
MKNARRGAGTPLALSMPEALSVVKARAAATEGAFSVAGASGWALEHPFE